MFTPPPSPQPTKTNEVAAASPPVPPFQDSEKLIEDDESSPLYPSSPPSLDAKRRTGRRYRWAVLLVPIIVIMLTAYSEYTSRCQHSTNDQEFASFTSSSSFSDSPTSDDYALSPSASSHDTMSGGLNRRQHGKRAPEPLPQTPSVVLGSGTSTISRTPTSTSTSASASSSLPTTSIPVASQSVPQIPSTPPTLPTPFPQPFDGSFAQNFSTVSCSNFFANMTQSAPFRSCRPFSLLPTSTDFINAQGNLTLMNSIVWGTCNTTIDYSQCEVNMKWFASALTNACVAELSSQNSLVATTLTGLNAFSVMHDVACLPDPTTNVYCYIKAVKNANPSDLYYYQLPQGIPLPKTSTPTCSACSKSVMGLYATALEDTTTGPLLTGLKSAYSSSAALSVQLCGAGFAQTNLASAARKMLGNSPSVTLIGTIVALAWMVLNSTS